MKKKKRTKKLLKVKLFLDIKKHNSFVKTNVQIDGPTLVMMKIIFYILNYGPKFSDKDSLTCRPNLIGSKKKIEEDDKIIVKMAYK